VVAAAFTFQLCSDTAIRHANKQRKVFLCTVNTNYCIDTSARALLLTNGTALLYTTVSITASHCARTTTPTQKYYDSACEMYKELLNTVAVGTIQAEPVLRYFPVCL
jgi:nicotinamidase-related amidase